MVDECTGYDGYPMDKKEYEEYYGEHVGTCKIHGSVLESCNICEEAMKESDEQLQWLEDAYEGEDIHYCLTHRLLYNDSCGLCEANAHMGRKLC